MTKYLSVVALAALVLLSACDTTDNSPADLTEPVLTAPADAAVIDTNQTTLSWNAVQDARTYYIELSPDSSFNNDDILAAETPNTSISTGAQSAGMYYWRVFAVDRGRNLGPASEVRTFVLEYEESSDE